MTTPTDTIACAICLEEDISAIDTCATCSTSYCFECIQMYLHVKIKEGQVRRLRCPSQHCSAILTAEYILDRVDPTIFQQYLAMKTTQSSGRICPQCSQPVTSTGRRIACNSCGTSSCGDCGKAYHLFSCQDSKYKSWRRGKARDVRSCPNCHVDIEKQGGCTHMTCGHCEFEFCWLCRVPWERHTEAMCKPLAFWESESRALGPTAPIRAMTKSVVAVAALAVAAVGVSVAAVVVTPFLIFEGAESVLHRQKQSRSAQKFKKLKAFKKS